MLFGLTGEDFRLTRSIPSCIESSSRGNVGGSDPKDFKIGQKIVKNYCYEITKASKIHWKLRKREIKSAMSALLFAIVINLEEICFNELFTSTIILVRHHKSDTLATQVRSVQICSIYVYINLQFHSSSLLTLKLKFGNNFKLIDINSISQRFPSLI